MRCRLPIRGDVPHVITPSLRRADYFTYARSERLPQQAGALGVAAREATATVTPPMLPRRSRGVAAA